MNIVLVLPKYSVSINDPCCFPIGFMMISSVLKQNGHNVKVLNFNIKEYGINDELEGYDVALFTGFHEFKEFNIRTAEYCKLCGIHTILGGAEATFNAAEMVKHFDCIVIGEGEDVIEQALHSNGIVQGTKPNLDNLPFPDYDGFGIEKYNKLHEIKYMGVLTSRGCLYSCRFCVQTCKHQLRKLVYVFEEIDAYKSKYKAEFIVFNDNTLNLSKKRFLDICKGMKDRNLFWSAAIRVDIFDKEMAKAAKESGCKYFVVGVESFKQSKLDAMDKKITTDQIISCLDLLYKYGIKYHGNVLTGLPNESFNDIVCEVEEMPKQYNIFPILVQPFIGTEYQTRILNKYEESFLADCFKQHAEMKGMSVYKEAICTK